jgi:cytochrome P450
LLPFGAGITYCPGRRFIRSEVKMLFIFLILNLDFEIKEGQEAPVIDGSRAGLGVFPPLNDIMVSITPRE